MVDFKQLVIAIKFTSYLALLSFLQQYVVKAYCKLPKSKVLCFLLTTPIIIGNMTHKNPIVIPLVGG